MSLRNYIRLGSTLSLYGSAVVGTTVSVGGVIQFAEPNTYVYFDTLYPDSEPAKLNFIIDGNRAMSITSDPTTGGTLHGTWTIDNSLTTSDRRLKKSIVPLYRALMEASPALRGSSGAAATAVAPGTGSRAAEAAGLERASGVGWVLRQLRPVSFKFKHGPEAKYSRFGFVAQELQQVLPSIVHGTGDEHLSVAYQDMIAVLTLASQMLQAKVESLEAHQSALIERLRSLEEKVDRILNAASSSETTTTSPPTQADPAYDVAV